MYVAIRMYIHTVKLHTYICIFVFTDSKPPIPLSSSEIKSLKMYVLYTMLQYVFIHIIIHTYVRTYCMYVCMYACMYVCTYVSIAQNMARNLLAIYNYICTYT